MSSLFQSNGLFSIVLDELSKGVGDVIVSSLFLSINSLNMSGIGLVDNFGSGNLRRLDSCDAF